MDINRAIEIINMPPEVSSPEEGIEAYKVFFKELFNVDVKDKNGKYADIVTSFLLTTTNMPAAYDSENKRNSG